MTNINPINVNTQGVGSAYGFGPKPQTSEETKEEAKAAPQEGKTPVSPDAVLNYMAQSAVSVTPKTIDPSKYVDKESEARIAGFMAGFEDIVAQNLAAINSEFPAMTDDAKMALALASTEKGM